jgi:uncharacterized protein (DUF2237 family)
VLVIENLGLASDAEACWVVKDEVVAVEFAPGAGTLVSAVGPNGYHPGDALITGSTGDRWCVSRDRFDAKYEPVPPARHGHSGRYRNRPIKVRAKRMTEPFMVQRTAGGDWLKGATGDWLLEYSPGDRGVVAAARFESVYRILEAQ